ncbi:hypothetical protein JHK85_019148 [Glycine max]|uniref:Uncharacterized protein n=1 Tax=Glycine max TaxID=3847 RepID=A0A0R0J3S9_SOYBN|nr:hypothetical protein JHK85_019148 [Glycine max]KAH1087064.1 hypothetical protein GYH30_018546 [Glycine max]
MFGHAPPFRLKDTRDLPTHILKYPKINEKEKTLLETKFCTTSLSTPLHARQYGRIRTHTPLSLKKKKN